MKVGTSPHSAERTAQAASQINGYRGVTPPAGQTLRSTRRRRSWVLGGLLCVLVFASATALLVTRLGGKVSTIMTARAVPAGHKITRADLTTSLIATDSIPNFAGGHMKEVIGKTAKVGLVKGELLNRDMLSNQPVTAPNTAQVGVLVKAGQLPAGGVAAGNSVMVVIVPDAQSAGANSSSTGPKVLSPSAPVIGSSSSDAGVGTVVTVQVPTALAAQLAAASSSGQVALVKVA